MKLKIFYILFFLLTYIPLSGYNNINTDEYYKKQLNVAELERGNGNYTKALEILFELKTIAEDNRWDDIKMMVLNNMGIVYTDILDYTKAIECFLESYSMALKESDKVMEMRILNNIAAIYNEDGKIEKAKEYVEKAYKIAWEENDSSAIGTFAINLGYLANKLGDFDLGEKYLGIGLQIYQGKDTNTILKGKFNTAENLYLRGRYNEAEELLLGTIKEIPNSYNDAKAEYLLLLSKVTQKKHQLSKAIKYAHESIAQNPDLALSIHIYKQLADLYLENNTPLLAVQYKDSVIFTKDSLAKLNNQTQILNNQIRFELLNSEKALAESNARQKAERILFVSILGFIVVIIIIIIWIFRIKSIRNKQRKQIVELELQQEKNQKLILEQQLKEQETSALLEQERLNNERKEKLLLKRQLKEQEILALLEKEQLSNENKQLAAKVLIQSNRNELIEEIIHRLSKIPIQSEDSQLQLVIRQLKTQLKESSELNSSIAYFDQINPSFLSSIKEKHPTLSATDIRFLSYLFLNFTTNEIAGLLNMSLDSCKKKRQRLAGKMGVETSQLYNYLLSI